MNKLERILISALAITLLLTCGCTAKVKKWRHLQRADKFFAAGQYPKAEVEYLNVAQLDSKNPRAFGRLAIIYYEQGRLSRAYAFLTNACALAPNDVDLRIKLGTLFLSLGRPRQARDVANLVLTKMPTNAEAPILLAESAMSRKDIEEIHLLLESLSNQIGQSAPVQLAFGALQFKQGDLAGAEASFKKAISLDPKSSMAHFSLANISWARNDLKTADVEFKTAAELSPPRSIHRVKYAEFKCKTGDVETGKRLLGDISKEAPDYLPALLRQAELAMSEKNYDECNNLVQNVLRRDSANYDGLLLSGKVASLKRDSAGAIAQFEKMRAFYPRDPTAVYQLALAHLLKRDLARAAVILNQAITLDPNNVQAILLLAEINLRQNDPVTAIPSISRLIERQPQIEQAHFLLATAYLMQKDYDQALSVYRRMMTLFPKNAQAPYLMGTILAQQQKNAEARQALERALELSLDYTPALEELVELDIQEAKYDAALERIQKQELKKPKAALPRLLRAKVFLSQGWREVAAAGKGKPENIEKFRLLPDAPKAQRKLDQAENELLKAIEFEPNLRTPYVLLAQLYVDCHKHQQALERLTALTSKTNDASALMQMGMINQVIEQFPPARDAYEKVLAVNSRFSPALNNLAYLYSEILRQPDRAHLLAEKARELLPYDPSTADTLGWILYKRGDYPRALALIQESAARLWADPEVQFHLGMTHYMMGEDEAARVALERAVQGKRDFAGKSEATQRLAILSIRPETADKAVIADLEKKEAQEPNDPIIPNRLAKIYERDGAIEKAVQTYERALKQNPQNAQLMGELAQLYANRLHQPAKALELAKQAHSLAPGDATISYALGQVVYEQHDYKWALSLLQEAAQQLHGEPEVLYHLAWAQYSFGHVDEAEATMQKALQAGKKLNQSDDATKFLAMVAAAKDSAHAKSSANQVVQILGTDSNYAPALMVSGMLKEEKGDSLAACQNYERVLTRFPDFTPARKRLAVLYGNLGDDAKTYEMATKAREALPGDTEVARSLGIVLYRRGGADNFRRAAQLLDESVSKGTEDGQAFYYLGMARFQLKQRQECKTALERALALNIQPKLADDAKKILAQLN